METRAIHIGVGKAGLGIAPFVLRALGISDESILYCNRHNSERPGGKDSANKVLHESLRGADGPFKLKVKYEWEPEIELSVPENLVDIHQFLYINEIEEIIDFCNQSDQIVLTTCISTTGLGSDGFTGFLNQFLDKYEGRVFIIPLENGKKVASGLGNLVGYRQNVSLVETVVDRIIPKKPESCENPNLITLSCERYLSIDMFPLDDKLIKELFPTENGRTNDNRIKIHANHEYDAYFRRKAFFVNGIHYIYAFLACYLHFSRNLGLETGFDLFEISGLNDLTNVIRAIEYLSSGFRRRLLEDIRMHADLSADLIEDGFLVDIQRRLDTIKDSVDHILEPFYDEQREPEFFKKYEERLLSLNYLSGTSNPGPFGYFIETQRISEYMLKIVYLSTFIIAKMKINRDFILKAIERINPKGQSKNETKEKSEAEAKEKSLASED